MKNRFLILAFLLSGSVHSIANCPYSLVKTGAARTMAEFEAEALVSLNRLCLDVWCEGRFYYEFQKLSCSEGHNNMDCTVTTKFFDPNGGRDRSKETVHTIICSLKGVPKISLPATGEEIDEYIKEDDFYLLFDDVCIGGIYRQHGSALKGKDGVTLFLPAE